MIRDRLVVGLTDRRLSERLQLDGKLTMATAVNKARLQESVKKQQVELQAMKLSENLDSIQSRKTWSTPPKQGKGPRGEKQHGTKYKTSDKQDQCSRCGFSP